MLKGKEKTIPIFAIIVLLIAMSCNLYVHARQVELEKELQKYQTDEKIITIFSQDYKLDDFFSNLEIKTIQTDDGKKTGVPLDSIITYIGIGCPSCNKYTFKAIDGYQQTVDWSDMQKGIITEESRVFFPGLAHAFWVSDVIEIIAS